MSTSTPGSDRESEIAASTPPRTGAREAEGSGLLSRPAGDRRVGSNPTPSAQEEIDAEALRQLRRSLKRAEKAVLDAWLILHQMPTKGDVARLWRRWLRNGITKAHRAFGDPTPEEVAAFVVAEIKRDERRAEDNYRRAVAREEAHRCG